MTNARRIGVPTSTIWLIWLGFSIWLTSPGFLWEIQYFRNPGRLFFRLLITTFALSPIAIGVYHQLRRHGLWRWEFVILVAEPVAAALFYEPRAALIVLAVLVASFTAGRQVREWLRIPATGAVEDLAISSGLGLGMLHCLLFVLGLAGLYTILTFELCILFGLIVGRSQISQFGRLLMKLHDSWSATPELQGWLGTLITVFSAAFVACGVMVVLAPSVAYDVLRAHLPLAHYYATQHALRTPPYLDYGYLPQGVETLMTLGYVLAGDAAAQMLPPVYFALALLMAFRVGRMCGLSRLAAITGVLFAAATPIVHWTGSVAKNDLALVFYMLAALHGYLHWRESGDFRSVMAGAFFLAMGAGVKHGVVYAIPPLVLLFGYAALREEKPWPATLKLAAIFIVFGTFWHVHTWLQTGSPAYPFSTEAAVSTHGGGNWWSVALRCVRLPWDIHFHGRAFFESPLENPMGIALVLFAPMWLLAWKQKNRLENACLFFCGLYLLYWAVVQGVPRFAIAPILLLQVLTAGRLILFCRRTNQAVRFSLIAASVYALMFALLGAMIIEINAPQLRYFAGQIGKQQYLRETLLPYRAVEFVSRAAGPEDSILSVNACPFLYVPNPGLFDCVFAAPPTPEQIDTQILHHDYRFLILPTALAAATPSGWREVYTDESYRVYQRPQL